MPARRASSAAWPSCRSRQPLQPRVKCDPFRMGLPERPDPGCTRSLELGWPLAPPMTTLGEKVLGESFEGRVGLECRAALAPEGPEVGKVGALEVGPQRIEKAQLQGPDRFVIDERSRPQALELVRGLFEQARRIAFREAFHRLSGSMKSVSRNSRDDGEYGEIFVRSAENSACTGLSPRKEAPSRPRPAATFPRSV